MQSSLFTTGTDLSNILKPEKYVANKKYKFCAWNIQNTGLERAKRIAEHLIEQSFDLLILSEITHKASTTYLIDRLAANGYQVSPIEQTPNRAYHTVILSRLQFTTLSIDTEILRHRTKIIRLDASDSEESIYLVGAYGYPDNFRNSANRNLYKSALLNKIITRLNNAKKKIMLLGDLNVVEIKFHEHCQQTALKDAPFFEFIKTLGFKDVIRDKFPSSGQHTWFCPRTGNGQRLDHFFSGNLENCIISDLNYDHEVRISKLSDHSALRFCIEFGF